MKRMMPTPSAITAALPMPWTKRAATSQGSEGAIAQAAEEKVKRATPAMKTRR